MTAALRYQVQPVPYGLTHHQDLCAKFSVIDTRPELEHFETATGVMVLEAKPPPWRTIGWYSKQGHAEMVASALNRGTNG